MGPHSYNGKTGEWIRWVGGLVIAAAVAYFTAVGAIEREIAIVKANQENNFGEVLRRLELMQQDIREIRATGPKNFYQQP